MFFKNKIIEQDENSLKIKIGMFLSKQSFWFDICEDIDYIDFINNIDRYELSKNFIQEKHISFNEYNIDKDELIKGVAMYIDFLIPRHYFINLYIDKVSKSELKNSYDGIYLVEGLIYKFKENYKYEKEFYEDKKKIVEVNKKNYQEHKEDFFRYRKCSKEMIIRMIYENLPANLSLNSENINKANKCDLICLNDYFYMNKPIDDDLKQKYIVKNDIVKDNDWFIDGKYVTFKVGDFVYDIFHPYNDKLSYVYIVLEVDDENNPLILFNKEEGFVNVEGKVLVLLNPFYDDIMHFVDENFDKEHLLMNRFLSRYVKK